MCNAFYTPPLHSTIFTQHVKEWLIVFFNHSSHSVGKYWTIWGRQWRLASQVVRESRSSRVEAARQTLRAGFFWPWLNTAVLTSWPLLTSTNAHTQTDTQNWVNELRHKLSSSEAVQCLAGTVSRSAQGFTSTSLVHVQTHLVTHPLRKYPKNRTKLIKSHTSPTTQDFLLYKHTQEIHTHTHTRCHTTGGPRRTFTTRQEYKGNGHGSLPLSADTAISVTA